MVAWIVGTNFCALGLMARPCAATAPTVSGCPHCPAEPAPDAPVTPAAPCCQEVRAELPPGAVTALPPLAPVALPTDWVAVLSLALAWAPEAGSPDRAFPDSGPPSGGVMSVLLGRCAPVHAPPVLG